MCPACIFVCHGDISLLTTPLKTREPIPLAVALLNVCTARDAFQLRRRKGDIARSGASLLFSLFAGPVHSTRDDEKKD
jgi:hypothetical protein